MRVLIAHVVTPRRSRDLAVALAAARHEVVVATPGPIPPLPRVRLASWAAPRRGGEHCHRYLRDVERAVLVGQAVADLARDLARRGFEPDVVYGDGGSGVMLYAKEVFPEARAICAFGPYHRPPPRQPATGSHNGRSDEDAADAACLQRARNGATLLDLAHCDHGVVSSEWQLGSFPHDALAVLSLLPEGVDDGWFSPPGDGGRAARRGAHGGGELVTLACPRLGGGRGIEALAPAVAQLQGRHPGLRVAVVAGEAGAPAAWAAAGVDPARLTLLGSPGAAERRDLLRASAVYGHVGPLEDTAGLLEAMSCGCAVLAPDLGPAREVLSHGSDGLVFPVSGEGGGPRGLAAAVADALEGGRWAELGAAARRAVLARFRRAEALARLLRLVDGVARGLPPAAVEGSVAHRLVGAPGPPGGC